MFWLPVLLLCWDLSWASFQKAVGPASHLIISLFSSSSFWPWDHPQSAGTWGSCNFRDTLRKGRKLYACVSRFEVLEEAWTGGSWIWKCVCFRVSLSRLEFNNKLLLVVGLEGDIPWHQTQLLEAGAFEHEPCVWCSFPNHAGKLVFPGRTWPSPHLMGPSLLHPEAGRGREQLPWGSRLSAGVRWRPAGEVQTQGG